MKLPSLPLRCALALAFCSLASPTLFAQDTTPPVILQAISDVTVSKDAAPTIVHLKKTFGLQGVTGNLVRFATSEGNIDVELFASAAPKSVANFLSYANAGSYNESFVHRSVPSFVIQGGGYAITNNQVVDIAQKAPVAGEHTLSNTRGTIAFALSTGPDSGTNQWFFNLADNTGLDVADKSAPNYDGGPFTVFGRITGDGLAVADAIAALKIVNANGDNPNGPFGTVPVLPSYNGTTLEFSDLVFVTSITNLALFPTATNAVAALTLKVKSSNPDLVTPTISGKKLTLTYTAGQTGTATITVTAKDTAKSKVKAIFNVNVR